MDLSHNMLPSPNEPVDAYFAAYQRMNEEERTQFEALLRSQIDLSAPSPDAPPFSTSLAPVRTCAAATPSSVAVPLSLPHSLTHSGTRRPVPPPPQQPQKRTQIAAPPLPERRTVRNPSSTLSPCPPSPPSSRLLRMNLSGEDQANYQTLVTPFQVPSRDSDENLDVTKVLSLQEQQISCTEELSRLNEIALASSRLSLPPLSVSHLFGQWGGQQKLHLLHPQALVEALTRRVISLKESQAKRFTFLMLQREQMEQALDYSHPINSLSKMLEDAKNKAERNQAIIPQTVGLISKRLNDQDIDDQRIKEVAKKASSELDMDNATFAIQSLTLTAPPLSIHLVLVLELNEQTRDAVRALIETLWQVVERVITASPIEQIRIGCVCFGDLPRQYVQPLTDFETEIPFLCNWLHNIVGVQIGKNTSDLYDSTNKAVTLLEEAPISAKLSISKSEPAKSIPVVLVIAANSPAPAHPSVMLSPISRLRSQLPNSHLACVRVSRGSEFDDSLRQFSEQFDDSVTGASMVTLNWTDCCDKFDSRSLFTNKICKFLIRCVYASFHRAV